MPSLTLPASATRMELDECELLEGECRRGKEHAEEARGTNRDQQGTPAVSRVYGPDMEAVEHQPEE